MLAQRCFVVRYHVGGSRGYLKTDYLPIDSLNPEAITSTPTHTACPWKGHASYYSIEAGGQRNTDTPRYYPQPKAAASHTAGWTRRLLASAGSRSPPEHHGQLAG